MRIRSFAIIAAAVAATSGAIILASTSSLDHSKRQRDIAIKRDGGTPPHAIRLDAARQRGPSHEIVVAPQASAPIQRHTTPTLVGDLDEEAIEAEVKRREKPAEVKFDIATKMEVGTIYPARLEVLREGAKSAIDGTPELYQQVQILNKVSASISSPFMKIELLTPAWQEISAGKRGYWTWRIEPQTPGKAEIKSIG